MKIMIVGATSAIAQAVARRLLTEYPEDENSFVLIGRNPSRLEEVRQDLTARGANDVCVITQDLSDLDSIPSCLESAWEQVSGVDVALLAHGDLPKQHDIQSSAPESLQAFNLNGTSFIVILTVLATLMEARKSGILAVITSVAADRGRQSNYIYGSAKAAVSIFCQGLRNRLYKSGVHVVTVKPGFVDTPMTRDFEKGFLWVSPDRVGKDIVKAIHRRKNVIYTPRIWLFIMWIIRWIPEPIFKKLNL